MTLIATTNSHSAPVRQIEKVDGKPAIKPTSKPATKPEDKGEIKLPCDWQAGEMVEYRATLKNSQGQGTSLVRMPVVKIAYTIRVLSRDAEEVIVECSATPPAVAELPDAFIKHNYALVTTMYDVKAKIKIRLSDGSAAAMNIEEGAKALRQNLDALLKRTDDLIGLKKEAADKQRESIEQNAANDMDGTLMQLYREVIGVAQTRVVEGESRSDTEQAIATGRVMTAKTVRSMERTKDGGFSVVLRSTVPNSAELGQQLLGMVRDMGVKLSELEQRTIRDSTTSIIRQESNFEADAKGWLIRGSSRSVIRSGIPAMAFDREVEVVRVGIRPVK